ncbi:MAG: glycosyltransferase family 39 protein [Planctomycetota bacterium]
MSSTVVTTGSTIERAPGGKRPWRIALVVTILGGALALRLGDFTEPWTQQGWQHMGATFAIMARNYVEQGYLTTRLAPATNPEPPPDGRWDLFLHHPPFFPLALSLSFLVFGVHEWSARLVPILASLIELIAILAITRTLFGEREGLVAAALAAIVPATAFYGSHVCELGPVVMAFASSAFALHLRYLAQPSRPVFVGLLACVAGAATNDWPGVYMAGAIVLHLLWMRRRREAITIVALVAALLLLHLAHVAWATGDLFQGGRGGGLKHAFEQRTWLGIERAGKTVSFALNAIGGHLVSLYTWPVVILAGLGLVQVRRSASPSAVAALVLAGLAHTLIFGEGATRHDFWNITMAPFLLMLAGAGMVKLTHALRPPSARVVTCAVLTLAAALPAAYRTHQLFEYIESDYFYTLGRVINQHTQPGDQPIATTEFQADPMAYYARRRISPQITDALVSYFKGTYAPGIFVVAEKKFQAHEHEKVFELLSRAATPTVVPTESCGKVYIFDLLRRPSR